MKIALIFGAVVLYFIFWFGVTAGGALLIRNGIEAVGVGLTLLGILGFLLLLFPGMHWLAGAVYTYPGEGTAVAEAELRQRILAVNQAPELPVQVSERGETLVVSWRYAHAQWWNLLSRSGLTRVYELHIKLDEESHTATLIDVHKSVDWRAGPGEVRLRGGFSRGVDLSYERQVGYGWDDAFQFGKVVDYEFRNSDIKQPIVNLLVASGWRVKFGLW